MNSTHSTHNSCFLFYSCHSEQTKMTIKRVLSSEKVSAVLTQLSVSLYTLWTSLRENQMEIFIWNNLFFYISWSGPFPLPPPIFTFSWSDIRYESNRTKTIPRPSLKNSFQFFIVSTEKIRAKKKKITTKSKNTPILSSSARTERNLVCKVAYFAS